MGITVFHIIYCARVLVYVCKYIHFVLSFHVCIGWIWSEKYLYSQSSSSNIFFMKSFFVGKLCTLSVCLKSSVHIVYYY